MTKLEELKMDYTVCPTCGGWTHKCLCTLNLANEELTDEQRHEAIDHAWDLLAKNDDLICRHPARSLYEFCIPGGGKWILIYRDLELGYRDTIRFGVDVQASDEVTAQFAV